MVQQATGVITGTQPRVFLVLICNPEVPLWATYLTEALGGILRRLPSESVTEPKLELEADTTFPSHRGPAFSLVDINKTVSRHSVLALISHIIAQVRRLTGIPGDFSEE